MGSFNTTQHSSNVLVIDFPADVVGGSDATELSELVRKAAQGGTRTVVFNMEQVNVMNSSGLGMIVGSLTTLQGLQARLVIVNVPDKVQALFKMTHLDTVFDIQPSIAQALATA